MRKGLDLVGINICRGHAARSLHPAETRRVSIGLQTVTTMYQENVFIVRLPAPLQQEPLARQKALADIAYRWIATLNLLLAAIGTLLVLAGL